VSSESLELRWFVPGRLPAGARERFGRMWTAPSGGDPLPPHRPGPRVDTYLLYLDSSSWNKGVD